MWAADLRLIVFSDLDGTLLDHETYSHAAARPALEALKARDIPLILATSKTAAEVAPLHAALALAETPAIVENGAGIFRPTDGALPDHGEHDRILMALRDISPELRATFTGFSDLSAEQVAEITGLSPEGAALAKRRCHSEPGLWRGDDAQRAAFLTGLGLYGVKARSGGRFLTLSLGRTKADAMREISEQLQADVTIALGDAPNDTEMLETADHGVIVRNDHGTGLPHLAGEDDGRIRRTDAPGPEGWAAAVLSLLEELDLKDPTHG